MVDPTIALQLLHALERLRRPIRVPTYPRWGKQCTPAATARDEGFNTKCLPPQRSDRCRLLPPAATGKRGWDAPVARTKHTSRAPRRSRPVVRRRNIQFSYISSRILPAHFSRTALSREPIGVLAELFLCPLNLNPAHAPFDSATRRFMVHLSRVFFFFLHLSRSDHRESSPLSSWPARARRSPSRCPSATSGMPGPRAWSPCTWWRAAQQGTQRRACHRHRLRNTRRRVYPRASVPRKHDHACIPPLQLPKAWTRPAR